MGCHTWIRDLQVEKSVMTAAPSTSSSFTWYLKNSVAMMGLAEFVDGVPN